jgi:peptidoglycan/xylan/chitin deacetylase (PgdA/CDA1 family)
MSARSVVLAYHAVGPIPRSQLRNTFVPLDVFERQMDFLARRRSVVSLDELVRAPAAGGTVRVAVTFDDAYRSTLTRALPVLERHRFPATVFAPTAWLGDRNRWDAAREDLELELMSDSEIVELSQRGFEVGSHGHRHVDLSRASEEEVREDLRASVERISALLGRSPRYLAYPYGRASELARKAAADAGFEEAFALEWQDEPFARSRVPIFPHDRGWRFAFKASGRYAGLRRSRPVAAGYARLIRPLRRALSSA